jgi:multidrug efflux system outer membrane protein
LLKSSKSFIIFSASAAAMTGCASMTVPERPVRSADVTAVQAVPQQFFNAEGQSLPMAVEWWSGFDDPTLAELVESALMQNRELEVAQSNIQITQAGLDRQRLEKSYSTGSDAGVTIGRAPAPNRSVTATASAGFGASWEFDAFDRIAATIKAAEFNVEAAEQAKRDVAVIVSSETALAYIDLRGAQKRLQVAQDNAQTQAQSLELLNELLDNGRATVLDINRADAQYRTTVAQLPTFQAVIDGAISRLAVLTGGSASQPAVNLTELKARPRGIPSMNTDMALGSPADLIRRRPDIRAAEAEIARRLALSDVDRARLFPRITLGGDLTSLLGGGTRLGQSSGFSFGLGFGLGPTISWEGPDLRRVRADIDIADAQTERAYTIYEQTVLQALSDVEIALANLVNERQRRPDLERAVMSAREAAEIAQLRFDEGIDDFLDVLDAQRTRLEAEDRLAQNELQTTRLAILTYRELGGT